MASQITSITIVYSSVYSGADQRKHQRSASLAFVRGIHRWPVNSPHKWPVTRKIFPFDDVIMRQVYYSSCCLVMSSCIGHRSEVLNWVMEIDVVNFMCAIQEFLRLIFLNVIPFDISRYMYCCELMELPQTRLRYFVVIPWSWKISLLLLLYHTTRPRKSGQLCYFDYIVEYVNSVGQSETIHLVIKIVWCLL